ncbi:MAG TPA: hypothetical protein VFB58_13700 [Chloroflexota bacterium]|nr:hypothetical protein [Chloroflexota bacterium]
MRWVVALVIGGGVALLVWLSVAWAPGRTVVQRVSTGISLRGSSGTVWRAGPAPSDASSYTTRGQHGSSVVSTYEDIAGNQPWNIWFRWNGCHLTRAGSLRFTIFMAPRTGNTARFWAGPVVERARSGNGTYEFPGRDETNFFVNVEVPSKQGCRSWDYGAETN